MFHRTMLASVVLLTLGLSASLYAGEVRGFRNDGTGVFPDADPPIEWGPGKHEVWSTDLGGGLHSSPVLIGDKIITAVEPFSLICLSAKDGKVLWNTSHDLWKDVLSKEEASKAKKLAGEAGPWTKQILDLEQVIRDAGAPKPKKEYADKTPEQCAAIVREAYAKVAELMLPKNRPAGQRWVNLSRIHGDAGSAPATPVTDGKYVYMVFGNGLGICCELETGKRLWHAKLAGEYGYQDHGTAGPSPVLAGDRVILRFGHWIYGLKTSDGTEVWEHRDSEQWHRQGATSFSTPLVVHIDKTPVVITLAGQFIRASDGKMLADLDLYVNIYAGAEMVASPVVDKGVVYFPVDTRRGPDGRLVASRPLQGEKLIWKPHYLAVQLPDRINGDTLQTKILWKTETPNGFTATSPVVHNGLLYTRDYQCEWLRVFDIRDGSLVYEKKVDWLSNTITVNALSIAGGNLYINSGKTDRTLVIKTGPEYVEVARNVRGIKKQNLRGWAGGFGLLYSSSPVFSGTRMYWREGNMMYCFDKNAPSRQAVAGDESKR